MNTKIAYRNANFDDLDDLLKLEESCFNYDSLGANNFKYFLSGRGKGNDLIVQLIGKKIVGYGLVLYRKNSSSCRLYSLAISPEHQGQSLGRKLMDQLIKVAKKRGASSMRLEVKESNSSGIKLYEKMGFEHLKLKAHYYDDGENAKCMTKLLK